MSFTGKVNLVARAWDCHDVFERNQIDTTLSFYIIKLQAAHADGLGFSRFLCLSIKIDVRHEEGGNAENGDDVGNETKWVRPCE